MLCTSSRVLTRLGFVTLLCASDPLSAQAPSLGPARSSTLRGGPLPIPAGGITLPLTMGCQAAWLPAPVGQPGTSGTIYSLAVFDDGSGPALYAGGSFATAGSIAAHTIAKWDGSDWSQLGSGLGGGFGGVPYVKALAVFDDGSGPALYAGGNFTTAGPGAANAIARWNGSSWLPLGSGMDSQVNALTVFDDGGGPALYAGGDFSTAGGTTAKRIARWSGSSWSQLGSGTNSGVYALTVFDDGGGPALYAGGVFTTAGGGAANRVAKWSGSIWSQLGSGMNGYLNALAVSDDGGVPALYAGGNFTTAGGSAASDIAKWNGSIWSQLGSGMNFEVRALTVFDDGYGPALHAGGFFTTADGLAANHIAEWSGSSWSALASGTNGYDYALTVFDDGTGPGLYTGGLFTTAGGLTANYVALWGDPPGCGTPGISVCEPGTGAVIDCPCANAPAGSGLGCDNGSNTGGAQLGASGIARLSFDTVVFTTSGEVPGATSIVLQGTQVSATGVIFGQGVLCVSGVLRRLYVKSATLGSITAPQATDLHVHARSAALGDSIAPGTQRGYAVYYRDPIVLGGCPATSTFNVTQQLSVAWIP